MKYVSDRRLPQNLRDSVHFRQQRHARHGRVELALGSQEAAVDLLERHRRKTVVVLLRHVERDGARLRLGHGDGHLGRLGGPFHDDIAFRPGPVIDVIRHVVDDAVDHDHVIRSRQDSHHRRPDDHIPIVAHLIVDTAVDPIGMAANDDVPGPHRRVRNDVSRHRRPEIGPASRTRRTSSPLGPSRQTQ